MQEPFRDKLAPSGKKYSELRVIIRVLHDEQKIERGVVVPVGDDIDINSSKIHVKLIEWLQPQIDAFMDNIDKITTDQGEWYDKNNLLTV